MHPFLRNTTIGIAGLALLALMLATHAPIPAPAQAQQEPATRAAESDGVRHHRMIIHVTQNDPVIMNMALNNAENLIKDYDSRGEKVEIEFVAYGPGLHMLRSDTSPVKEHVAALSSKMKQDVTFSGCGNTMRGQSKQEHKDITLVPEARVVPAGIARIMELEEQGWSYVRP
jgi:intracellular sulfur oxidation DsrE/DsrF family protein